MSASTAAIGIDRAYRFASKVPAFDISSSDPVDTATGVPVNKTITLTFSMSLHSPSVDNTNITISPNVARTTALDAVNYRIVTIDPTSNLAASTKTKGASNVGNLPRKSNPLENRTH
jgi:hypothetical protein